MGFNRQNVIVTKESRKITLNNRTDITENRTFTLEKWTVDKENMTVTIKKEQLI